MKKIILNAFGEDRPGLVSKITKVISSKNGNIETSKMVQLESDFTLLMLILCTYGFYADMIPLCDYMICLFLTIVSIITASFMRFMEND